MSSMSSLFTAGLVLLVIVVVIVVAFVVLYNNLVQLRNRVDNAWAQVDVQLQRRLDLVPNLVETVKGYASHENATLAQVTQARGAVMDAKAPADRLNADGVLSSTLKSLFAVAEAYPDLKANANFQQLQAELSGTEDKISYMRQSYNDTVMKYNTAIQTFPGVIVATLFHFDARESFDAASIASAAPVVSFDGQPDSETPAMRAGTAPVDPPSQRTQR